ncbi:DNA replication regulator sld2 [Termitomyces sp. T112]|nr:hypothetical protein C0989_009185 [Termitomyces sp. Mn162]KAG5720110.1 DNA replication regulator sld2 [Termitomyces sp. T112]
MDVSTVKAEVKAWERSFKAANGRDPTIQDIKNLPEIAAKYKLYKKLSKTTVASSLQSSSAHTSSDIPTTPPRSRPRSHQLTEPRLIETTAPLSSFNPFSPQKNKGKEKASQIKLSSRSNYATSPFKSKQPSQDPFPLLDLNKPSTSSRTPPHSPTAASSALSRARKRLRGDPVSPSPNKEKRRRVGSQSTLPFAKLAPDLSESSDDEEMPEGNLSFISDSPMKAPSGAKSFRLLFDEANESKNGLVNGKSTIGRTKTQSTSRGLFGLSSVSGSDEDALWDAGSKHKPTLFKPPSVSASNQATRIPDTKVLQARKLVKRPLSNSDTEDVDVPQQSSFVPSALIPPSPPSAEPSINRQKQFNITNGKGKIEFTKRKKAKTTNKVEDRREESIDDSDVLPMNVKIIKRTQASLHSQPLISVSDDSEPDPILGYSLRVARPGHEAQSSLDEQEGRLEIDLPDKLRRVLAIDTTKVQARYSHEDRMVKSLLLGQRLGHYDPAKGGEIWDVGEDDARIDGEETWKDTEGEDDWEGEPVPWEVGEL